MEKEIADAEKRLGTLRISRERYDRARQLAAPFFEAESVDRIRSVSNDFGLTVDVTLDPDMVEIVSAEDKYLFNFLSGAFGNSDLRDGAKRLPQFLDDPKFVNAIRRLSGRAISEESVVQKVMRSVGYLEEEGYTVAAGSFVAVMRSLCGALSERLRAYHGAILLGVSSREVLTPFERLLAHEVFHVILMERGIWFSKIKEEYDYVDEGLATLLASRYAKNKKPEAERFWSGILAHLGPGERFKKMKEVHGMLETGGSLDGRGIMET